MVRLVERRERWLLGLASLSLVPLVPTCLPFLVLLL